MKPMSVETKSYPELSCVYADLARAPGSRGLAPDAEGLRRFYAQALKRLPGGALALPQHGLVFQVDPLPALYSGAHQHLRLTACLPLAMGREPRREPVITFPATEVLELQLPRAMPVERGVLVALERCREWLKAAQGRCLGGFARLHVHLDGRVVLCVELGVPLEPA